jgi:hypothetical protein
LPPQCGRQNEQDAHQNDMSDSSCIHHGAKVIIIWIDGTKLTSLSASL